MGTCRECMAFSGGCCVSGFREGWEVVLFPSEVVRISRITGREPTEFVDDSALTPQQHSWFTIGHIDEEPLWNRLFFLWTRLSGITDLCSFLASKGYSLPYQSKPWACCVYPLYFNITTGQIDLPKETDCPVCGDTESVRQVLDYFGDDMESLQRAFRGHSNESVSL